MSTPHVAYVPCASAARQTLSDRRKRSLNVPSTRPYQPGGDSRVMPHANAAPCHPAADLSRRQPSRTAKLSGPAACQSPPVKNGHGNGKPACTMADGTSPVPLPKNTAPQRPTYPRSGSRTPPSADRLPPFECSNRRATGDANGQNSEIARRNLFQVNPLGRGFFLPAPTPHLRRKSPMMPKNNTHPHDSSVLSP